MEVPSLLEIASEAVASYISDGYYENIDYNLSPAISNRVYPLIQKTNESLIQIQSKLNVTKMDILALDLDKDDRKMVKTQTLEALIFDISKQNKDYCTVTENDEVRCDLFSLLTDILNNQTKENLKYLEIHFFVQPLVGWTRRIGRIIPNLQSLIIPGCQFIPQDFHYLCRNFPNLKILDIGASGIKSLNGISILGNLEVLCIRDNEFQSSEDLLDLFGCERLRMLDVSNVVSNPGVVANYLRAERSLKHLEFLDCTRTDIDRDMLYQLIGTHRNLKQVVAHETLLRYSTLPGIDMLNEATPESLLASLQYYVSIRREKMMSLLRIVYDMLFDTPDIVQETRLELLRVICKAMKVFEDSEEVYTAGLWCTDALASENFVQYIPLKDINLLVNQLMNSAYRFENYKSLRAVHSKNLEFLGQKTIRECPVLNVVKMAQFFLTFFPKLRPLEIMRHVEAFQYYYSKLKPEDFDYVFRNARELMLDLLHQFMSLKEGFDPAFVKLPLDVLHKITKTNGGDYVIRDYSAKDSPHITSDVLMLKVCKHSEVEIIDKVFALQILISFTTIPDYSHQFWRNVQEENHVFINIINEYVLQAENPKEGFLNCAFLASAILSHLMCYSRKEEEFWRFANTAMTTFCEMIQLSEEITVDLDIFLKTSLLADTLNYSRFQGTTLWAFLTMKTLLDRDESVVVKFIESGLYEIFERSLESSDMDTS